MFRNFLLSSVLFGSVTFATAAPITFTDPNYSVDAFAAVDSSVNNGSESDSSPPRGKGSSLA
jgi:hypothetical protein